MTKYQQYAEYKDSGVEWLGEIPKEWIPIRLKHLLLESLVYGANEAAEDDNPKNPRYIRITDMNSDGTLDPNTFRSLPLHIAENYLLKDGDILLARSGATVGKSFYYKSEFGISCFAGYLIRARPHRSKLDSKFAYWFFQSDSYWKYVAGSQIKATIQNVSAEKYGDLYLSLPTEIEEQSQIANFLDYETAKIDSLIEKQQQLIQLLKEKRQAVISHAVTKGLNPNVPMKDSGVEWLGGVPQEWMVSRLGYETWIRARLGWKGLKADEYVDDGYIFLATPNIKGKQIDFNNVNYINKQRYEESPEIKLNIGDVLLTKDGSTLGTVNIVRDLPKPATVNSSIAVITPYKNLASEFLLYLLTSSFMVNTIQRIKGGMGVPHLFQADLNKFYLPIPDPAEQFEIVKFLDQETAKIDMLISKAESAIQLMQERRTALISAAVTGKIDVRNWKNPNNTKMELSA